jgi:predicted  nucleic acid-binding Zn-ribbon protein
MQPEISHRCPACGVSIRDFDERALFCPECGQPLATGETHETNIVTDNAPETDEIQSQPIVSRADDRATEPAAVSDAVPEQPSVDEPPKHETPKLSTEDVAPPTIDPSKAPRHGARERTRETLHRASNVARGAIEGNVKRVEKIHHVSSVMFEEAHYDPSLRFVLVALGLFLVFVLLLVLSKVMS